MGKVAERSYLGDSKECVKRLFKDSGCMGERVILEKGRILLPEKGYIYYLVEGSITDYRNIPEIDERAFCKNYSEWSALMVREAVAGEDPSNYFTADKRCLLIKISYDECLEKVDPEKFWKFAALEMAREYGEFQSSVMERVILPNETYFLRHLERNNGWIEAGSLTKVADKINMSLRSLQRVIKKLKEKSVIAAADKEIFLINRIGS